MEDLFLAHIGVLHKSGRYPWGSGANPHQRNRSFLDTIDQHKKDGLSEAEIGKIYDFSVADLRALKSIAKNQQRQANVSAAQRLKEKGYSNQAIADKLGVSEPTVRNLLNPSLQARNNELANVAGILRDSVHAANGPVDVGIGVERHLGVSKEKLATAVAMLREEGYAQINVQEDTLGTTKKTTIKTLAPPGMTYQDIVRDKSQIKSISTINKFINEDGLVKDRTPVSIDSKRLSIRYKEQGGDLADGVIYIRPGVADLSLGARSYVQARIAVDGTHYIKGMAMYKDDLPKGVDIEFNSVKSDTGNKLDALKKMSNDPDLPFGSLTRPHFYGDKSEKKSPINIVNDESDWDDWSRSLSSQMLSKQRPELAKQQLAMTFDKKKAQFDEIMSLTNPAVKQKLLLEFADSTDASSVHLKAAALPRQKTHVILPFSKMKDDEIYAPNFNDGEKVVLVRFPHGGTFEIPELTVNNRQRDAKAALGNASAAVGINPKVAERLSGADFDGDTVLVIPNNSHGPRSVQTTPALEGLRNFDPKVSYPKYEGMKVMSNTQQEMGAISNLITDMTIRHATHAELARAVRHSMVVIDAEKKELNYKQSAKDHGIAELKQKYQSKETGPAGGASTLISRASSEQRVERRRARRQTEGGPIDPVTGEKVFVPTGEGYIKRTTSKRTGVVTEKFVPKTEASTKMAEVKDAHDLSSGTGMEKIYADHANRLKALANTARRETLDIKSTPYSPSAKAAYKAEVSSLNDKLDIALRNAPLERQAQLVGNAIVRAKVDNDPSLTAAQIKKLKGKALTDAREYVGAGKVKIDITPSEWQAIQAGAVTHSKLEKILQNADPTQVKQFALPRQGTVVNSSMLRVAKQMVGLGYTQAEIASQLGVAVSTLNSSLNKEG